MMHEGPKVLKRDDSISVLVHELHDHLLVFRIQLHGKHCQKGVLHASSGSSLQAHKSSCAPLISAS
jgi:hypothetical protein